MSPRGLAAEERSAPGLGAVDRILAPLDRIRSGLIRASLSLAPTRWVISRRERRFLVTMALGVLLTLALSWSFPAFLFATTPLLFGIPHVLGDVRYLVLRRGLPRHSAWLILLPAPLFVGFRVAEYGFGAEVGRSEVLALAAWGALAIVLAGAHALRSKRLGYASLARLGVASVVLFLSARFAYRDPFLFRLGFAHAHNVVGPLLFLLFFRSSFWVGLLPVLAVSLAGAALFTFVTLDAHGFDAAFGARIVDTATWMAPGFAPATGVKLVVLFVFLQGMHYAVLLSWMPQLDTRAEGTLSFRMSARTLVRDFTWPVLALALLSMAGLLLYATSDVQRARLIYLGVATFHGYLELVMLGYFFVGSGFLPLARAQRLHSSVGDAGSQAGPSSATL